MERAVTRLLGRLGGRNHALLALPSHAVQASVAWGMSVASGQNKVQMSVPLPQLPPPRVGEGLPPSVNLDTLPLALDSLLPRIVELCQSGSGTDSDSALVGTGDRQARTAAAEALHSALTVIIGAAFESFQQSQTRGVPTGNKDSAYASLYENLLPAALSLSCSRDPVPRQLFSSLLSQLAKWFSNSRTVHEKEADALLTCLFGT